MLRSKVRKMYAAPDVLAFSASNAADRVRISLPARRFDYITMNVRYNVTAAGMNEARFQDVVDRLRIGEGSNLPIQAETGELSDLVAFMEHGPVEGRAVDTVPTSGTTHYASFRFKGPFQLSDMDAPEVDLALLAPTEVYDTPTAFSAEVTFTLIESDEQEGPGYYFDRQDRPTDGRHEFTVSHNFIEDILIIEGADTDIDDVKMASAGAGKFAVDFERPYELAAHYRAVVQSATAAGRFLIENVDTPYFPGRRLVVEQAVPAPAVVYSRCVVQG